MLRVITLTTDFGLPDPFVGTMKDAKLGLHRGAPVRLQHPTKPGRVTVYGHLGGDMPKGTFASVKRQAGLATFRYRNDGGRGPAERRARSGAGSFVHFVRSPVHRVDTDPGGVTELTAQPGRGPSGCWRSRRVRPTATCRSLRGHAVDQVIVVENGIDPAEGGIPELVPVRQEGLDEAALRVRPPHHGAPG